MSKKEDFLVDSLPCVRGVVVIVALLVHAPCPGGRCELSPGANSHLLYGWATRLYANAKGEIVELQLQDDGGENSNSRRNSFLL